VHQGLTLSPEYVAGFFDGEGCVGVYPSGKSLRLKVQLIQVATQQSAAIMGRLFGEFGGNLSFRKRRGTKTVLAWQLDANKAVTFLKWIQPYVLIKRDQIDLAVYWQQNRSWDAATSAVVVDQLKRLKGRLGAKRS
jgi:hypothetical protein